MGQRGRLGSICLHDTSVHVWEDGFAPSSILHKGKLLSPMEVLADDVKCRLRARGFTLGPHPLTTSASYTAGKHPSGLEVHVRSAGRSLEVDFFQNIARENANGGQYDFNRFPRMVAVGLRQRCLVEMAAVTRRLAEYGYPIQKAPGPLAAKSLRVDVPADPIELLRMIRDNQEHRTPTDPWKHTAGSWHNGPDGWYKDRRRKDPQGRPLEPGDLRYVLCTDSSWPGKCRLIVGRVYPYINDYWDVWVRSSSPCVDEEPSPAEHLTWTRVAHVPWDQIVPDPVGPITREQRRWRMSPQKQMERLQRELDRAVRGQAWRRVAALGQRLERQQRLLDTMKSRQREAVGSGCSAP